MVACVAASKDQTVSIWDLDLPEEYRDLEARAASASDRPVREPQDAGALVILGERFALREADHLAADYLERARMAEAAVSPVPLARCYRRLGRLRDARREFEAAMKAGETSPEYLRLCIAAVSSATSGPGAATLQKMEAGRATQAD